MIPETIRNFIQVFSKLPSLGPRLSTRLAFYLINLDPTTFKSLEHALSNLKSINRCSRCFFLKDANKKLCAICADLKRNKKIIAIVEKETDLLSLEKTGEFNGQYLVLGELPERGTFESAQKLRLENLKERIKKELDNNAEELIIAVNPNTFGDFTADLIKQEFGSLAKKITRLGRGIPTGGEIEFADEETLKQALERRN